MHRQLDFAALQLFILTAVLHNFNGLVIGAGGDQFAITGPGRAIDRALVMLGAFEDNGRLTGGCGC